MTPCFAVAMTFLASSRLSPRLGSSVGSASSPKHGNIGNAHEKGRFGNESRYSVASAAVGLGLGAAALSSSRRARGTACRRARGGASATFDATTEIGVCAPVGEPGEYLWDPLGFTSGIDEATFRKYRQAEIKHGRAAMMGTLGLIFSGAAGMGFKNDYEVLTKSSGAAPAGAWLGVLVILIGFIELTWSDEDRAPGDFGDPFNWNISKDDITKPEAQPFEISVPVLNDKGKLETGPFTIIEGTSTALAVRGSTEDVAKNLLPLSTYQNYEINHGRLAMFGFIGAMAAEYNTGHNVYWQWAHASQAGREFFKLTFYWAPKMALLSSDSAWKFDN